jgi:nucleoside 2-deoxyribosyltransferase
MTSARRIRTYFAAPLFNEMERRFNSEIAREIERYADVFLPQRDGGLLTKLVQDGVSVPVAEQRIFEMDLAAMESSDLLIAVLDGSHIDEGVAFEIGYAFALGKSCVGLQTDSRRLLPTGNNPMLGRSLAFVCHDRPHLLEWVRNYVVTHVENVGLSDRVSADLTSRIAD